MSTARDQIDGGREAPAGGAHQGVRKRKSNEKSLGVWARLGWQLLILLAFLSIWQYAPLDPAISRHVRFLNRFDVSSPTAVAQEIGRLATGNAVKLGTPLVWPFFFRTIEATFEGLAIGMALGVAFGLVLSEFRALDRVLRPFITLVNSAPRVALIPIVVLLVGPSENASVVSAVLITFFLGFFNAYEGAMSIPPALLANARLLGARRRHTLITLRLPQSLSWTFGVLPNAISFRLSNRRDDRVTNWHTWDGATILASTSELNASLCFAVVAYLSATGALLIFGATKLRQFVIIWEIPRKRRTWRPRFRPVISPKQVASPSLMEGVEGQT